MYQLCVGGWVGDVPVQLVPLSLTMAGMMLRNPVAISRVLLQLGPGTVLPWFGHYIALLTYTSLHLICTPLRNAVKRTGGAGGETGNRALYPARRALDAWAYGSGSDYTYHEPTTPPLPPALLRSNGATSPTPAPQRDVVVSRAPAASSVDQEEQPQSLKEKSSKGKPSQQQQQQQRSPTPQPVPVPVAVPVVATDLR